MGYTATILLGLASRCAANVAPQTVLAIVRTESRGEPLAFNVNGARQARRATTEAEVIATARRYVDAGYSVDLGLGQINSRNMTPLGLTWDTVFKPCTNIAALGRLLTQNFQTAQVGRDPQTALRVAFSLYNTGSTSRGFFNGYVAKVVANADVAQRAAPQDVPTSPVLTHSGQNLQDIVSDENIASPPLMLRSSPAPPPTWNVFERAAYDRQTQILTVDKRISL